MNVERANFNSIMGDIAVHYKHACDKHPYFADRFFTPIAGEPPTDCLLAGARAALRAAINEGCVDAFMVLNCETCEIAEAYARGNMEQAREECLDAIAVLMRMVDVIDGLQKLGKFEECAECPFFRAVEGSGNPEPVCTNPVGECEKFWRKASDRTPEHTHEKRNIK